eukprot:TRINITY_DN8676_c0_g1_i1.p1 TRINITY_DN8676_c0_g1~~TRINITY_DN8676_c0_g1_i1.p1  ORF type:complete len:658 (+),score=171.85 TRINITY_DN8676_c0_g1_i1:57-2030(+)
MAALASLSSSSSSSASASGSQLGAYYAPSSKLRPAAAAFVPAWDSGPQGELTSDTHDAWEGGMAPEAASSASSASQRGRGAGIAQASLPLVLSAAAAVAGKATGTPQAQRRRLRRRSKAQISRISSASPLRSRNVTKADAMMSEMTAKLIASEFVQKARSEMSATSKQWAVNVQEAEQAKRYGQTLRALVTVQQELLEAMDPDSIYAPQIQTMVARLEKLRSATIQDVEDQFGGLEEQMISVPKYYYSELRRRRQCAIPSAPALMTSKDVMAFFVVDALAALRWVERLDLLSKEGLGDEVSSDTWTSFATSARKAALEVVAGLVRIYGEDRVAKEWAACAQDEGAICKVMEKQQLRAMEDGESCPVDLGNKSIYIVSDCTGETAEKTVIAALGQFQHCFERELPADVSTFRFTSDAMLEEIVQQAAASEALIVYTLVDPSTNDTMVTLCNDYGVTFCDLWSDLLAKFEGFYSAKHLGRPGRPDAKSEKYTMMIECIEYTKQLDDGVDPSRWQEADLILVGPSRSGKTPLAYFMAQRGVKVANYPLVPNEMVPNELLKFDPDRVFALRVQPSKLIAHRTTRMKTFQLEGGTRGTNYTNQGKVFEELAWVDKLYKDNPGWTVLDASEAGVEENCAHIFSLLEKRGLVRSSRGTNNSGVE